MSDRLIIEQCAPTLASLKSASLFNYRYQELSLLTKDVREWNQRFAEKGIRMMFLKAMDGFALIYVYRPKMLQRELEKPGVADFLDSYGYTGTDIENALTHLISRIKLCHGFPHEIGLFLGYPLEDVKGFIENKGRNCLCVGCWKVYCNQCEAQKTFALFNRCRAAYMKLWSSGARSLMQLTRAA